MKKILTITCLTTMILSATTTFSSCSSDNNDTPNVQPSTAINPKNVFTGGLPKTAAEMSIQTNEKGQVVSLKSEEGIVTFKYNEATTRGTAPAYDVIMTVGDGKEKLVCNLYLNKDGFVSRCEEEEYNLEGMERKLWDFTYNSDGQLLTMLRIEGGKETTTIKYQDGDIVETKTVSASEPEESSLYKVYYTSNTISTPIINKGCIMLFDETLGIDMDEMRYAYYAGLLGKATKHLPVRLVSEKYQDTSLFEWTLNAAGYPTLFSAGVEKYPFTW